MEKINHAPLATFSQRAVANAFNLVLGAFPVIIPRIAYPVDGGSGAREAVWLVVALTFIQLIFVNRMQGSPGAVFCGLRVECLDRSRPSFRVTVMRAIPFLALVLLEVVRRLAGEDLPNMVLGGAASVVVGFLVLNAIWGLAFFGVSIVDQLTQTRVVKRVRDGVRPWGLGLTATDSSR